jgi:hypothetical protein
LTTTIVRTFHGNALIEPTVLLGDLAVGDLVVGPAFAETMNGPYGPFDHFVYEVVASYGKHYVPDEDTRRPGWLSRLFSRRHWGVIVNGVHRGGDTSPDYGIFTNDDVPALGRILHYTDKEATPR